MSKQGKALIVASDADERLTLKEALRSVARFSSIRQISSPAAFEKELESSELCDIVFMSSAFPIELISSLVSDAKKTHAGASAAYVLLLGADNQDSKTVGFALLNGIDAFLCRPFSVQSLTEIADLASRLKKERSSSREERAIGMLLDSIVEQLDTIAFLRANGYEASISMRNLRNIADELRLLEPDLLETFHHVLVEKLSDAPFPAEVYSRNVYKGPSGRIKARQEAELVTRVNNRLKERAA